MSTTVPTYSREQLKLSYSLTGEQAAIAIEKGLAEADWYQCPVPREVMRTLLERKDGPALRDTAIWFGLILGAGFTTYALWGTSWAVLPYVVYSTLYASTSDSRWHEAGHGTAFKTDWLNNVLYEISSFMVMRESTVWRWSHTRHHSDTIIVGRDPEISVPRPPEFKLILMKFFNIRVYPKYFSALLRHTRGVMSADEKTYIPDSEFPKIFAKARVCVAIYLSVIALSIYTRSILPLLFVGLTNVFGTWLLPVYSLTQHTGLAENVLDHRLNCRTVYMNLVSRYLYWNMNYHVEHHMYPLVPYHALPRLHEVCKDDCPTPYPSLWSAWKEIMSSVSEQMKNPGFHVKRRLPDTNARAEHAVLTTAATPDSNGWIAAGAADTLGLADVVRFDLGKKTYAIYRDAHGKLCATDGICTHGNTHLAAGLVKGTQIECPKHNGRFNLIDGSPARVPVCRALATYPVEERNGSLFLNVMTPGGVGARAQESYQFRVISNDNVATFIKELVVETVESAKMEAFTPGDYLQFDIPAYDTIHFGDLDIAEPYMTVWKNQQLIGMTAKNPAAARRNNYSVASNPQKEPHLRFNVRIATPPPGQDCTPGVGSSYLFSRKPGDIVTAIGPFGDFHIKPTQREMLYIGGGAGMAPLRAHISHLLETQKTARRVSFWYGARSRQELFYDAYFRELSAEHPNFNFHMALSSPLPEDEWTGDTGFIHEVVLREYLAKHPNPAAIEYYLCGPPMMIKACSRMLADLHVPPLQIAYDEF